MAQCYEVSNRTAIFRWKQGRKNINTAFKVRVTNWLQNFRLTYSFEIWLNFRIKDGIWFTCFNFFCMCLFSNYCKDWIRLSWHTWPATLSVKWQLVAWGKQWTVFNTNQPNIKTSTLNFRPLCTVKTCNYSLATGLGAQYFHNAFKENTVYV